MFQTTNQDMFISTHLLSICSAIDYCNWATPDFVAVEGPSQLRHKSFLCGHKSRLRPQKHSLDRFCESLIDLDHCIPNPSIQISLHPTLIANPRSDGPWDGHKRHRAVRTSRVPTPRSRNRFGHRRLAEANPTDWSLSHVSGQLTLLS